MFISFNANPSQSRVGDCVIRAIAGESEFLQKVKGHDINLVFGILDELMDAVKVFNPKLYNNTIQKL